MSIIFSWEWTLPKVSFLCLHLKKANSWPTVLYQVIFCKFDQKYKQLTFHLLIRHPIPSNHLLEMIALAKKYLHAKIGVSTPLNSWDINNLSCRHGNKNFYSNHYWKRLFQPRSIFIPKLVFLCLYTAGISINCCVAMVTKVSLATTNRTDCWVKTHLHTNF